MRRRRKRKRKKKTTTKTTTTATTMKKKQRLTSFLFFLSPPLTHTHSHSHTPPPKQDTLPAEYDARVKAMEVDEKPTEDYSDIGGLDKQIQELVEAVVLPVTHKESCSTARPGRGRR
jgi:SpoVK/Ycf46/Vps4 family AAA+-type ATPase